MEQEQNPGASGTRGKRVIAVTWTIQTCCITVCGLLGIASIFALDFVLKPLIMAYFITFLMGSLLDLLEDRPYGCMGPCGKLPANPSYAEVAHQKRLLCAKNFEHPRRVNLVKKIVKNRATEPSTALTLQLEFVNFVSLGKVPHGIACLLTLVVFLGTFIAVCSVILTSIQEFSEHESKRSDTGGMAEKLVAMGNYIVDLVEEQGVVILRDEYCVPGPDDVAMYQEQDATQNYVLNIYLYGFINAESETGETIPHGVESDSSCDKLPVFRLGAGIPLADLIAYGNVAMVIFNDTVLILLLAVFILLERPEGSTFGGGSRAAIQVEQVCKQYIELKTILSLGTGAAVGILLWVCGTKLSLVWGILAFALNYVPVIGNLVSWLLPIPLIVLDSDMSSFAAFCAIMLPLLLQMWSVNFLEPEVLGAALNMTPLSLLLSLVFFTYAWGMLGAVLSVPLLASFKVLLHNSEHPLSEILLRFIREDADIDIEKDLDFDEWLDRMESEEKRLSMIFGLDLEGEAGDRLAARDHRAEEHLVGIHNQAHKISHLSAAQRKLHSNHGHHGHTNSAVEHRAEAAAVKIQSMHRGRAERRKMFEQYGFHPSTTLKDDVYEFLENLGLQRFHAAVREDLQCQHLEQLNALSEADLEKVGMDPEDCVRLIQAAKGISSNDAIALKKDV